MGYAALLVHIGTGEAFSDARVRLAGSLARRFGVAVIGVAAEAPRPPPIDAFGGAVLMGEVMVAEEEQIEAELKAAEGTFRAHPALQGLTAEWRCSVDLPAAVLARESRSVDLVIVGRDRDLLRAGPYRSANPGEVIMAAGRPVLVAPPGLDAVSARVVVVGWKETREARRAVSDALPLLLTAEHVHVVAMVREDGEAAAGRVRDVVRHLQRHNVKAEAVVRARGRESVAEDLAHYAEQVGADLIVAGGYGHARLTEWVFGGVTRDLLRQCPMCCLLSH